MIEAFCNWFRRLPLPKLKLMYSSKNNRGGQASTDVKLATLLQMKCYILLHFLSEFARLTVPAYTGLCEWEIQVTAPLADYRQPIAGARRRNGWHALVPGQR